MSGCCQFFRSNCNYYQLATRHTTLTFSIVTWDGLAIQMTWETPEMPKRAMKHAYDDHSSLEGKKFVAEK